MKESTINLIITLVFSNVGFLIAAFITNHILTKRNERGK
mgnify:CR=1 FL=1